MGSTSEQVKKSWVKRKSLYGEAGHAEPYKGKSEIACHGCGVSFFAYKRTRMYCSKSCKSKYEKRVCKPSEVRFLENVNKIEGGCWLWTGHHNGGGYGCFWPTQENRQVLTHRYSWELVNGAIPDGLLACHKCDTPSCVNPDHIFLGTHKDNSDDKIRKGRQNLSGRKSNVR